MVYKVARLQLLENADSLAGNPKKKIGLEKFLFKPLYDYFLKIVSNDVILNFKSYSSTFNI